MSTTGLELLGKRGLVHHEGNEVLGKVVAALNPDGAVVFDEGANLTTREVSEAYLDGLDDFMFLPDDYDHPIYCWVGDGDFELTE